MATNSFWNKNSRNNYTASIGDENVPEATIFIDAVRDRSSLEIIIEREGQREIMSHCISYNYFYPILVLKELGRDILFWFFSISSYLPSYLPISPFFFFNQILLTFDKLVMIDNRFTWLRTFNNWQLSYSYYNELKYNDGIQTYYIYAVTITSQIHLKKYNRQVIVRITEH